MQFNKKKLKGVKATKRVAISEDTYELVNVEPLLQDRSLPVCLSSSGTNIDLVGWCKHNKPKIDELLLSHRALLFRGFNVPDVTTFEQIVGALSFSPPLEYRDRTTPRTRAGGSSYSSTVHPASEHIRLHNEGTYWERWAQKLFFFCLKEPGEGGQTPIADVRNAYHRIPENLRDKFANLQWRLVRNYNDGFGLSWQEVFQTDDPAEVEKYCSDNSIDVTWKSRGRLRTSQTRPAIRHHPITGELVWFNHAAFFHKSGLDPTLRDVLTKEFDEMDLPFNTYFGDGTPITDAEASHLREAYEAEEVVFDWQQGDIMLLDNMSVAHGRYPYKGDREILVAMTDPTGDELCSSQGGTD